MPPQAVRHSVNQETLLPLQGERLLRTGTDFRTARLLINIRAGINGTLRPLQDK
jgi:hypothetical protein